MGIFGSAMNLALSWFSKSSEQVLLSTAPIMLPSVAFGLHHSLQINVQMGTPVGVIRSQLSEVFQLASELQICA